MKIEASKSNDGVQSKDQKAIKEASAMLWTKMFESALKGNRGNDEEPEDPMKMHVIEEQAKQMGGLAAEHFKSQWEAQLQWVKEKQNDQIKK